MALALLQLIPLPPSIWTRLPGRQLVGEIDTIAGLGAVWRPISLVPYATWNAFFSLIIPCGVMVLGVRTQGEEQAKVILCLVVAALLSAVLALVQLVGPADRPISLYRVTSTGAIGLFANRNHESVFLALMLPVLAMWSRLPQATSRRTAFVFMLGFLFVPIILASGSRAGLICALCGAGLWLLLIWIPDPQSFGGSEEAEGGRSVRRRGRSSRFGSYRLLAVAAALTILIIIVLTIAFGRAESLQRMMSTGTNDSFRLEIWPPILAMIGKYFPFGSGLGSFVHIYQVDEPRDLLSTIFTNHAHNDFLEVALTGGLPAMLLILYAAILVALRSIAVLKRRNELCPDTGIVALGLIIILMLSIASVADYPLRTPALAAMFALAAVWAARPFARPARPVDA